MSASAESTTTRATGADATLNELPLLRGERLWGFWGYSSVNVGLSIATWAFLQGGAVALYAGAKAGIASIVVGYGISTLLVALAPCLPSAKYGVEQFVGLRSAFGSAGARVLMIAMSAVLAAAWSAVLAIMCGHALANVANTAFGTRLNAASPAVSLIALLAVVVCWVVLSRGPVSVEWVNRIVAPGLVVVTIGMLIMIFTQTSWSELAAIPPLSPSGDPHLDFMLAVELNIAGGFAWWPNVGNLARLTTSSRAAFWPNMLGLFVTSVLAAVVGAFAALALSSEDPTKWMVPLGGVVLGMIALAFVGFANITSVVAQGYSSMVALKGGGGRLLRRVPWPVLAGGILLPAAVLVFFPGAVYDNYSQFVSWGATLVAPLCAVQLVDYFLLRRGRLALRDLYLSSAKSRYGFWRGVNPAAFASVAAGAVTYALLLNPVTYEPAGPFRYLTASLPAVVVAGALHYLLTICVVRPLGKGGYRDTAESPHVD
ncbi:cytosine permease [Amycolatopsis taiwanensis]|uniref:Cytosine/uracil/thiamine/allantoin permease n=1 Tax=Amycolatopsis taiwanensis TaxID=342230 RepID=A0A9W6VFF7_9PSEU|nr:cytosine permease [Amycolatopsis taiwanensis]GLY69548.1 cytosine/uracil/thiamine/allantoin permease [Amycolatopsis taiwanensis]